MARKIPKRSNQSAKTERTASRAVEPPAKRRSRGPAGHQKAPSGFPVVGVGASAGGLEAFTAFLKHLPSDSGMAFVLIQHLDPKHHSGLTDLLAKATKMPVQEVNATMPIDPNRVYVIAP